MNNALLRLLHLTDPTLPIGGFAHSSGLETYVQAGVVHDQQTASDFVRQMLDKNLQYTDAAFVSLAFDAMETQNYESVLSLDSICNAVKLPKEIRQASQKLCLRLLKIFQPLLKDEMIDFYASAIRKKEAYGHYCIAFGLIARSLGIPKNEVLIGFYYNAAIGFVTNCVKLIPLGQQQGQELIFSLQNLIEELAEKSLNPDPEMTGACCPGFDIRSMQHERLYSRLYMS
ncbi:urease accessory protein [Pseudarcicella hirudinis]|uniref:Urease accessory protein UreF n=1 Tax=Pseudarcicella hirudinis TaxID=1079859 RepID=A0A1I5S4G2_9BACT|nr:urease accessory protein UreF [Pseudarcicella hirudinis]SFP65126.1 urease accessory protein [Pseudarcicella hirudinis]